MVAAPEVQGTDQEFLIKLSSPRKKHKIRSLSVWKKVAESSACQTMTNNASLIERVNWPLSFVHPADVLLLLRCLATNSWRLLASGCCEGCCFRWAFTSLPAYAVISGQSGKKEARLGQGSENSSERGGRSSERNFPPGTMQRGGPRMKTVRGPPLGMSGHLVCFRSEVERVFAEMGATQCNGNFSGPRFFLRPSEYGP